MPAMDTRRTGETDTQEADIPETGFRAAANPGGRIRRMESAVPRDCF